MKRYLIIDGLNFFIRSFVVNPSMNLNGDHVGGSLGFLIGLNKLVRENQPTDIVVVWDGEGGSLKRRSMFKDYKAGRKLKVNREYDNEDPDAQIQSFMEQGKIEWKWCYFRDPDGIVLELVEQNLSWD